MNLKRIIIAIIAISITFNLSTCAGKGESYSEEVLEKEKEKILNLLDSGEAKDIQKSIDHSIKYGLQADLEIGKEIVNLLDDVQSDDEILNTMLEYIADIPAEEKQLLADDLTSQYNAAAKNGQIALRDGIFHIIRFCTFAVDKEKKEAYDAWTFTKSNGRTLDVAKEDPTLFNQLWVLSAKFGDTSDVNMQLRARNAHKEITEDTKIDLFVESINKIPVLLQDEEISCQQFQDTLWSIENLGKLISDPENELCQDHIDMMEKVLVDDIFQNENYLSCQYPTLDHRTAALNILNVLEYSDPQMTCGAAMAFLENTATVDTSIDTRTERWASSLENAKNNAAKLLSACEGEVRDQFIEEYFNNHVGTNSYFANIAIERELSAMGSTNHADALVVFIQSLLNSDWEIVEHYELNSYFEEEENAPYQFFIGPVIDDLYSLDNELGMAAALQLMANEKIAGGYSGINATGIQKINFQNLESDEIVVFFVQFINKNGIDLENKSINLADEIQSNQTANFRLMQAFRELNVNKNEVVPFFASFLESTDPAARKHVARLLQNELEADINNFSESFNKKDLAVIAGAYEYAYEILDKEILIEALNEYGDSGMANAYLNDHGAALSSAAKTWAKEHGYQIIEFEIPAFEFD